MLRLSALFMLTAAPLAAQEVYGTAELSFGQSQTAGAPVALQGADGSLTLGRGDLSFGSRFQNGLYLQADLGVAASDNGNAAPNTLNTSSSLVLRAGRAAGRFSYGGFVGALSSDHDNDASDDALRLLAGMEGSWEMGQRLTLGGHLGYLTGTTGSDSVATVTNGVFTGLSLGFAATERLSLSGALGYLNGKMDAPATVVELWTLELRADYALTPNLSLFAAAQYGESHQKEIVGPDDITDTTTLLAGLTYRFGGAPVKTQKLGYLEYYLSNSGGILE